MPKQTRRKLPNYEVISLVGNKSASGAEAMFFRLSKSSKFGVKVYDDQEHAEQAYKSQKLAASKGLAPKVGKRLVIMYRRTKSSHPQAMYGYETQIARKVYYKSPAWKNQSQELERRLIELGMGRDFHPTNCGLIGQRLVCVDFGNISTGYDYI